jgi:hypothetical protein
MNLYKNYIQKKTIKKAFELKKSGKLKNLQKMKKLVNDMKSILTSITALGTKEKVAYKVAEQNNFYGNPDFYWHIAESQIISYQCIYADNIEQIERIILSERKYIRFTNKWM